MHRITIIIVVLFLTSCTTTAPSPQDLNWKGNEAYFNRDYNGAIEWYSAAMTESIRTGDLQYQAIAMYGLARSNGHLCNLGDAENWLIKSIDIRRQLPNIEYAKISQNLFELGRLYIAQHKWELASQQFSEALPMLQGLNIESKDPMGYANLLQEYQTILINTGNTALAKANEATINRLKSTNAGATAQYISDPYPDNCAL